MKNIVIYHRADFDGLFCREIARKFLPADTELVGWDYGDAKLAFPSEGTVYVLDLSPECFEVQPIEPYDLQRLVWIDHHKSAIEKFNPAIAGYRIDGVAACRLAWQWFKQRNDFPDENPLLPEKEDFVNRNVEEPLAVRLAGEYDIWDKRDPLADQFQYGLRSQELTPQIWHDLLAGIPQMVFDLIAAGRVVEYVQKQQDAAIIQAFGFTVQFEGLTFLACNHARFNSHLFTAGLKPEHDACFGFNWTGKEWRVSLYHAPGKEHHDLSQIAVKYGGGGHRGACGFRTERLPFLAPKWDGAVDSETYPHVLEFAMAMERELEANRYKGNRESWLKAPLISLVKHLEEEVKELIVETSQLNVAAAKSEAADVANLAMMIADNLEQNAETLKKL